jgi:hypothetical protein
LTAGIAREIKNPLNFVNNVAVLPVELLDELKQAAVQVMGKHPGRTLFCGHARRLGAQDRRMLGEDLSCLHEDRVVLLPHLSLDGKRSLDRGRRDDFFNFIRIHGRPPDANAPAGGLARFLNL